MTEKTETPKEITTEIIALTTKAERTLGFVKAFKIDSNESYSLAAEQLKKIKESSRQLSEERLGITRPMDEAKKKIMAHFSNPLNFLADAEKLIKKGMGEYQDIVEGKRRKEQKRLDDIAAAERKRLAEEEAARVAEEKKKAQAKEEETPDNDMTAEVVPVQAPVEVVPVIVKSALPKVKGISTKQIWYAEIVDPKKILEGVLAGTIPMAAITINQPFFNTQAKALKREFNYPGAVAKTKKSIGA